MNKPAENFPPRGIRILGTGSYKPIFTANNEMFTKYIETSDEWIRTRTGISERRLNIGGTNYKMAGAAGKSALENAGVSAEEIDLVLVSTCTPDFFYPSVSCIIQKLLGAKNAACMDISAACTGFISALDVARTYLALGTYRKILVVASEFLSSHTDYTDRATCVLFGDGAGAVVVEAADKAYASFLGAEGELPEEFVLYCRANYKHTMPFESDGADELMQFDGEAHLKMDGTAVYKFAVEAMPKAAALACERAGIKLSEIDLLIPHQANIRIIKTAAKALGIPMERVYTNIEQRGNTSSACIPTCLDELSAENRLKPGMKLCLVGFGAGLTYGAVCLEY